MNKLIAISMVCLITGSCQKDTFSPFIMPYWGQAEAFKNGIVWNPKVIAVQIENDSLFYGVHFDLYNDEIILRNTLTIWGLRKSESGSFRISSATISEYIFSSYYTILDDGDVLGDVYRLNKSEDNFIEITEVNGDEIKGKFDISFIRDKSRPLYLEISDTLRFENGTFHTRIIKGR